MIKHIVLGLMAISLVACKNDVAEKVEQREEQKVVTSEIDSSVDEIKVKTIQIGGESAEQKNRFQASYPYTAYDFVNNNEERQVASYKDEFMSELEKVNEDAISGITFGQHFDIFTHTDDLLVVLNEQYRSLGNTFSDEFTARYYDLKKGEKISVVSLFKTKKDFEDFATMAKAEVVKELKRRVESDESLDEGDKAPYFENLLMEIDEGTDATEENYRSILFDKDMVIVKFNKYQVAPGTMGTIDIKLDKKKVAPLIKDEYKSILDIPEEEKKIGSVITPKGGNESVDCGKVPCVALTFDDGPSIYTDELLDILKEKGAKASFFILGKSAKVQRKTVERAMAEGHTIANHSWNHKDLSKLDKAGVTQQIHETNKTIKDIIGEDVRYFRPPYGAMNGSVKEIADMPIVLWTIDPLDWKDRDAEIVAERMIAAKANGIVLAHDIHKSTVQAVPKVIDALTSKGMKIVTLDELFKGKSLKGGTVYSKG